MYVQGPLGNYKQNLNWFIFTIFLPATAFRNYLSLLDLNKFERPSLALPTIAAIWENLEKCPRNKTAPPLSKDRYHFSKAITSNNLYECLGIRWKFHFKLQQKSDCSRKGKLTFASMITLTRLNAFRLCLWTPKASKLAINQIIISVIVNFDLDLRCKLRVYLMWTFNSLLCKSISIIRNGNFIIKTSGPSHK